MPRSKTVAQLKDDCARGDFGEKFEREGMRLVWHGRIVRDQETLGEVVGKGSEPSHVHTFHLVAKRIPSGLARPGFSRTPTAWAPSPSPSTPDHAVPNDITSLWLAEAAPQPQQPLSFGANDATYQALLDSTHYLLFTARYHLFCLLGRPPLKWDETVPAPVIPQETAKQAVLSAVKLFADEKGWQDWDRAFELDEPAQRERVWTKLGREGVHGEIKGLWWSRVGRAWLDKSSGEVVPVEIDGVEHTLNIPPLDMLSATQLIDLLAYLRIATLLPDLASELEAASSPTPSFIAPRDSVRSPTRLIRAEPAQTWSERVAPFIISWTTVTHIAFSAVKLTGMLWMLTRGMRWDDGRFWTLAAGAAIFWVAEAVPRVHQDLTQRASAARAREAERAAAEGDMLPAHIVDGIAADAPAHVQAALRAVAAGDRPPQPQPPRQQAGPRRRRHQPRNLLSSIALMHMDADSRQLHIPRSSLHSAYDPASAQRAATAPDRTEAFSRRAGPRPSWWITQLMLPIALWVVTLIPALETIRARAIRRRETAMRVLVGELTAAQAAADAAQADYNSVNGSAAPEAQTGEDTPSPAARPDGARPHVLPAGLNEAAQKYYARVMARGEGIDWEEEREAQRALGVADEDADEGDGMRLRML